MIHFGGGNLDAGTRAAFFCEMPHAEDPKAERSNVGFTSFDHGERLRRNRDTPGYSRAKAWLGRRVCRGESELAREIADFSFREAGVAQRSDDGKLRRGLPARADLLHVIGIFAVGDRAKAALPGQSVQLGEELGLAEVAAIRRIRGVLRVFELLRLNHFDRCSNPPGQIQRFGKGRPRKAGAVGDYPQDLISQNAMSFGQQIGAIDTAAVCDNERCVIP